MWPRSCNSFMAVVTIVLLVLVLNGPLSQASDVPGFLRRQQREAGDPTNTKVIESFHIKSDIRFRFATTQIVSVVRNLAEYSQEIVFDVALPKEAFIVSFAMTIDGKVYNGVVKEKGQAKQDYQAAVNRGESAGIVQEAPRHSNTFDVSVNVAGGSVVNFTLNYQELLQRKLGVYEYTAHVKPGQAVEDFLVEVNIQENRKIISVKTPALRTDSLLTKEITEQNPLTIIETTSPQSARVLFKPTKSQQSPGGVSARFVVLYDVEHPPKGEILLVDGYFIHFFAPDLPPMPKDIIFVLDISGSMMGTRLAQLKTAMKVILKDLKPGDKFNIITFSSDVNKWQKNPVHATADQITAADKFVREMNAGGMTNIHKALLTALGELKFHANKDRASTVFFLTDGDPTEGELEYRKIAIDVREANEMDSAIFSLAFGDGAKFESLQTISVQNSGFARKIYEASDSALQVASLYKEISSVVMKDISISFLPSSVDQFTITDNKFTNIFNGSEVMVSGQVLDKTREFQVSIKGSQQSGEVNLVLETDDISDFILNPDDPLFSGPRDFAGIVEKMWAYLTIKQLLREKDKNLIDTDKLKELDKKVLEMSLKYKFVTPLTAMVVTKPGEQESREAILKEDNFKKAISSPGTAAFNPSSVGQQNWYSALAGQQNWNWAHHRVAYSSNPWPTFGTGRRSKKMFYPIHGGHSRSYAMRGHYNFKSRIDDPFLEPPRNTDKDTFFNLRPTYKTYRPQETKTITTQGTTTTTQETRAIKTQRVNATTQDTQAITNQGSTTTTQDTRAITTQRDTATTQYKQAISTQRNSVPKHAKKSAYSLLRVITIKLGDRSVCVRLPSQLASGVYRLVEADDGYFINLEVGCSELPCNSQNSMKIIVSHGTRDATVDLGNMPTDSWTYSASSNFVEQLATTTIKDLVLHVPRVATLHFDRRKRNRKTYYSLIIELSAFKKYIGPIAEMMQRMENQQRGKVNAACKSLTTIVRQTVRYNGAV